MIEAVNSTLTTSVASRAVAEQQSAARSFAANPERVQEIAKAPYVSPYIFVDNNFDRAVLQIRDSDTGDVLRQFPSEGQLEAYRRAQTAGQQVTRIRSQEEVEASLDTETAQVERTVVSQGSDAQVAQQSQQQVSAQITQATSVSTLA